MTITTESDLPISDDDGAANAVLVGGPLAGRVIHALDVGAAVVLPDDGGQLQEYRPADSTAFAQGQDTHLPVYRHFAPTA